MPLLTGEEMRQKMRLSIVRNVVRSNPDRAAALIKARRLAKSLADGPHEVDLMLKKIEEDTVAEDFRQALTEMEDRLKKRFEYLDGTVMILDTKVDDLHTKVDTVSGLHTKVDAISTQILELTRIVTGIASDVAGMTKPRTPSGP